MHRMVIALLVMLVVISGCASGIVTITSNPAGAEVYADRDRIGNTPLLASIEEIMPLSSYYGTFARTVITLRKTGYEDYQITVNKFTMPDKINARLVPVTIKKDYQ